MLWFSLKLDFLCLSQIT